MDAKKFLIGRLIASDGFPVHEKSLNDGYYQIENICEIMDAYVQHKVDNDELPGYSQQDDNIWIDRRNRLDSNGKLIEGWFSDVFLKKEEVKKNEHDGLT